MSRRIVLASTSRYRAGILASIGIEFSAVAPIFDERALDGRFAEDGPETFALRLARGKARSVVPDEADALVIGGDQIAVLDVAGTPTLLHQPGSTERAVDQLMSMSGTTHHLINGLVVVDSTSGTEFAEVDRQRITMRSFSVVEARHYVDEFRPFDCAGGYRLEDDADLIESVEGEHESGVIGLPIPSLLRLLARAGYDGPTEYQSVRRGR